MSQKFTRNKHTTKIRFIKGVNVRSANLEYYEEQIKTKLNIADNVIELRKEYVYKQGY